MPPAPRTCNILLIADSSVAHHETVLLISVENYTAVLWPDLRNDDRLSGHQSLPGNITRPSIAWNVRLGGPVFDGFPFYIGELPHLLLIYGGCLVCYNGKGKQVWKTDPYGIEAVIGIEDLDDDGEVEILASNGRSFFVFNSTTGETLCQEYGGPPYAGGFINTNALLHRFESYGKGWQLALGLLSSREVLLYDFSSGAATPERRHIFWMDDFFHPSLLAVDIDGDGAEELVVTKLSSIYVFDPLTGEQKGECLWTSGGDRKRNYGLFEAIDIDRNGKIDLVTLNYVVSRHVAVVENRGGSNLVNLWDRFVGHIYPHDESELRYCWNSVLDVDRDGRPEIVISTWNEEGSGSWTTLILDALSGTVRHEFPGMYLRGIFPGEENFFPMLLLSEEPNRLPATTATLSIHIWNPRTGIPEELWRGENLAPLGRFPRRTATRTAFRIEHPPDEEIWYSVEEKEEQSFLRFYLTDERRRLLLLDLVDGLAYFYWLETKGAEGLEEQVEHGTWNLTPLPDTLNTAALIGLSDVDRNGRKELIFSRWDGIVRAIREDGTKVFTLETGPRYRYGASLYFQAKPFAQPIVIERKGERYCVVPDGGEAFQIWMWNRNQKSLSKHLSLPARGRVGPEEAYHSPVGLQVDKEWQILHSVVGEENAAIRLVDLSGAIQKEWQIPDHPSSQSLPRGRTGIHEYRMIETKEGPVLFVSGFRTGSMNSEQSWAFDAETGELLWKRRLINEQTEAAFAPWNASTVWQDGDETHLVFLAKDTFCQVNVRTGRLVKSSWQLRPWNTADLNRRGMTMDDFSAYGSPVPVSFNAEEKGWVLLCNYGGMGGINSDQTMRWWKSFPLPTLTVAFGAVADIDNDGCEEIGMSTSDGSFIVLRADTGMEKWRLHLGTVAAEVVTCDIDGDGQIEYVMSTREGEIIALTSASNGAGLIKWRMKLPWSLGSLIIADIDSDGLPEILVVGGDGCLYCVRQREEREVEHDEE